MIIRDGTIYFALKEIAPQSPYSADYLRIRILQKKLQGTKVGREWYTSREWLDEYLARYAIKQFQPEAPKSEAILEPGLPEAHTIETASAPGVASPQAAEVESAAPVMANESIAVEGSAAGNSFEFKGLKLEKFKDGNLELKEEILRRHDFRELVGRLRMPVPKLFFAAPLIAALAFAALWPAGAKLFPWRAAAAEKISAVAHDAGAFLLSVEPPELQDFEKLFGAISDWPDAFEKRFAGMDRKRPVQESGEDNFGVGVAFRSAIAAAFQQVGDFALEARIPSPAEFSAGVAALIDVPSRITGSVTSISSIGDALRDFLSSLPRPRLPERLALLFNLTSPPLTAPQANAPVRLALEPKGQGSGSEQESPAPPEESVTPQQVALGAPLPQTPVRQVIETIETREVVRPADVSAFQAKLDELNAGLRTQVSKLITDVASLYDISDRKVTITRAFAPSQSINELQELKVDSGLTVRSGDITLSTGSLTLSGSSATLTTGGGLTVSGSAAISGTLGVSGTGTSTIGYGFTGATSGGSIGFGTSSPSQFFSVSGNTYLTGGLGLGTVTTSPGGLQTTGMAVIGSTLDVLGTGTSTFSGPLVIAGALSVNAGVVTISSTSTVTTQFAITRGAVSPHTFSSWATGVANSAVTDATLLVNSASAVADSNLLGIAIAGSPRFIVDAEGDIYGRNLILEGATTQASTTVSGAITIEGNATIGDAANADTHIIRGATNLYASTTQAALDIWNSSNGDILSLRSGTGQTPTTSFTFSSGGNFGIGSTTPTVGLSVATSTYITAGLGVGEATTSSGGLLVKGLGVFAQTLDIRGTGTSTYAGGITAAGLSLTNGLTITSGSLDASAVGIKAGNASTTNLSVSNLLTVAGTGTSTFTGGIAASGLASSNGFRVSAGDAVFAGGLQIAGSSNFTGNVGIGTTSPSHLLTVRGPFLAQGTSTIEGAGLIAQSLFSTTSLNFYTASNAAPRLTIDSAGQVGIGTTSPGTLFAVNGPGLFVGTSTIFGGLNLESISATGTLGFYTRGTAAPRMVIDSSGSVGIATSGPAATFSVVGSGYLTSGLGVGYATTGSGNLLVSDLAVIRGRLGVSGTTSPTVEFGLTGSGYLTGGLGIGEATTSSGGLLVKGLGVFAQTLDIRGTGTSTYAGGITAAGLSLTNGLTITSGSLDASAVGIKAGNASTTNLSVSNLLTVAGTGTSTFTGGISTAGLASSQGLNISAGDALFSGLIKASNAGTSTFTGGVSTAGLSSSAGITSSAGDFILTGGKIISTGTGTSTYSGGLQSTYLNLTGTEATSTASNGFNLAGGCFAVNGVCVGGSSSQWITNGTSIYYALGNVGVGTSTPSNLFSVQGNSYVSGTGFFGGTLTATSSAYLATAGGSVGIGTTSPSHILSVNGSFLAQGTSTISGAGLIAQGLFSTSTLTLYAGGSARLSALDGGNVGIGTTSPGTLLSISGPFLAQGTSTILGGGLNTAALQATGTLAFYTSGTAAPRMVIDSSGNIGIGTASPAATLHVVGTTNLFTGTGPGTQAITTADPGLVAIGRSAITSAGYVLRVGAANVANYDVTSSVASGDLFGAAIFPVLRMESNHVNHYALYAQGFSGDDGSARTVTNQYGVYIPAGAKGTNTTVTNAYGISVAMPTIGGTLNRAIDVTGAGVAFQASNGDSQIFLGTATDPGWTEPTIFFDTGATQKAAISWSGNEFVLGTDFYSDGDTVYKSTHSLAAGQIQFKVSSSGFLFRSADATTAGSVISFTTQMSIGYNSTPGVQVGAPTGGFKGIGTLNAKAVYDDDTLLTDWLFDIYYDGQPKPDDPYYRGQSLYTIAEVEEFTKAERHLPWMISRADFEAKRSLGNLITQIWQGQEQQQLYLFDHEERLKALESASSTLDSEISGGDISGGSAGWTLDPYSGRITTVFDLDLMGKDILNVRSVLSQNGTWRIDENGTLVAKKIETEALTVRNSDTGKTGITISDRVTGASYCAFVANGQWQTELGECGTGASAAAAPAEAATPSASAEPAPTAAPASDAAPAGDTSLTGETIVSADTATTTDSVPAEETASTTPEI